MYHHSNVAVNTHNEAVDGGTHSALVDGAAWPALAIDRRLPLPLHHQARAYVLELIRLRQLRPGDLLPTEDELQRRLTLSRNTIRQAMQSLVAEGRLERVAGRGTFVARPRMHVALSGLVSWAEEMQRRGLPYSVEVCDVRRLPAPPDVREALDVDHGAPVLRLQRLRRVEGVPVVASLEYLAPWCGMNEHDDYSGSLYAALEARGNCVEEADQTIGARPASPETAHLLDLPPHAPVLVFYRTSFDARGRPLVYEESACRGDSFNYTVRLRRQQE